MRDLVLAKRFATAFSTHTDGVVAGSGSVTNDKQPKHCIALLKHNFTMLQGKVIKQVLLA